MHRNYELTQEITRIFQKTDGFVCTFKVRGRFDDADGIRGKNVVNSYSVCKFKKCVDRVISETRRTQRYRFQFVPFEGGDRSKQTSYHIHGLIELPPDADGRRFQDMIRSKFQNQTERIFNSHRKITAEVWFERIDPIRLRKYSFYCTRKEDDSVIGRAGDERVLIDMGSFCLEWHQ
jgi:hypothetical protein